MAELSYGATPLAEGGVRFRVWAPKVRAMAVKIGDRVIAMSRNGEDFEAVERNARAGDSYAFILDGERTRPDPVSRSQPQGVHGPSQIVDPDAFRWTDDQWKGIALEDHIFYELHVGTFTPEGTFEAAIAKLPHLKALGITSIELMPVAEFPGARNWGYDGVDLYAPHSAYGGPDGLQWLVDAAHGEGMAVTLDVVYNHVGPEGNYLGEFGPYFTDHYRTPWGRAINFDGPGSDGVRRFFIENALYWLREYHIDALRLDAIHGIFDFSARHVLEELSERFHAEAARLGRRAWVIAESDLNDVRVIERRSECGWALDGQWHDEFHHSLVSVLTGWDRGFLGSFGTLEQVRKAITEGFVYDGIYCAFRGRRFGSSSVGQPGYRFVAFLQNHDQVANTAEGQRLSKVLPLERLKAAIALLLCSPYLPLLFMGEEFAEDAPFLYFTSHADAELARAVSEGRKREFADLHSGAEFLDPQSAESFERSKIDWGLASRGEHAEMLRFYRELIALRKQWPCLSNGRRDLTRVEIDEQERWLRMEREDPEGSRAVLVCNFGERRVEEVEGEWDVVMKSEAVGLYLGR